MSYAPCRYAGYEVSVDGEYVTLRMKRWEALAVVQAIQKSIPQRADGHLTHERLRGIAKALTAKTRPEREPRVEPWHYRNYKVSRPPSDTSSEIDMDHVLFGSAPYPVLSIPDMRKVYVQLEERNLSANQIADRLHVAPRTVVRWRRNTRKEKETG